MKMFNSQIAKPTYVMFCHTSLMRINIKMIAANHCNKVRFENYNALTSPFVSYNRDFLRFEREINCLGKS